jgi:NADH dehydrogenase
VLRRTKPDDREKLPRILILGGGFAGVYTAYRLQKELRKARVRARIGIVNRENFFVFYPMLPEIISGGIGTEHILNPIRFVAKHSTLFTGEVTSIDLERGAVQIQHGLYGHRQEPRTLYYDHLVIALGGVPGAQDVPGMDEYAFNVQRLSNAFALRNHLIDTLEQANALLDRDARRRLLTYVVIGGGPSGVEVIGELENLVSDASQYYSTIRPEDVRVIMVHGGDRLLQMVPEHLGHYTAENFTKRGVEILFNRRVTEIDRRGIVLNDGTRIEAATVVGSLGLAVNPLVVNLPLPHDRKGALIAHDTLLAGDYPNVWALGDNASVIDPHSGQPYPATAQHAVREAQAVAYNIAASLAGRTLKAIDYRTKGRMVPLGGHSAVAELYGVTVTGFPAWWLWRTYYLYQLPRWEKRLRVMFDWTLDLVFPPPLVQLKVGQPAPMGDEEVE